MSSLKRKIERRQRKNKSKASQKKMEETLGLFGKLPDHCLACKMPYDKKNKLMASRWRVMVDGKKEEVKLYCPQCWAIAMQMIEEQEKS